MKEYQMESAVGNHLCQCNATFKTPCEMPINADQCWSMPIKDRHWEAFRINAVISFGINRHLALIERVLIIIYCISSYYISSYTKALIHHGLEIMPPIPLFIASVYSDHIRSWLPIPKVTETSVFNTVYKEDFVICAYFLPTLRDRSLFMAGGGAESKVGGRRKYFEVQRVGIEKNLRSHEWASKKNPFQKFSPLPRHLLKSSVTLSHELETCKMSTLFLL